MNEIIYLNQWSVKEVDSDGSHHFIGFDIRNRQIVITSCIISYLRTTRLGITKNESKFFLLGDPGGSASIEAAWENWCSERKVPMGLDITKEYVG